MFKQGSFEDEIFRSMETSLVKSQTENKHGFNKLAKAADLLNEAAAIFDNAGMYQESGEIAEILQHLSEDVK
jgi:acid phosphatase family membrane protein YuiD